MTLLTKKISNATAKKLLPALKGKTRLRRDGCIETEDNPNNQNVLKGLLVQSKANHSSTIFSPILKFRGKQQEAFEKMKDKQAFALMLEMGCGKTKLILDNAWYLYAKKQITGLLIIAPKGVQTQWVEKQIPINLPKEIIGNVTIYKSGATIAKVNFSPTGKLDILAIHIDAIRTNLGKQICQKFLAAHKNNSMMVVDEAHRIKGYRSAVTKAAIEIGEAAKFKRTMTGTPISTSLLDEWSQFNFLDTDILKCKYVTLFRSRYCVMGGFENRQIIGHQNVDRFNELVAPHCFRGTKESLGLPGKTFKPYYFDLTPEQISAIKEVRRNHSTTSSDGDVVALRNTLLKIQQISNGFLIIKKEDGSTELRTYENPRIQALKDILDQLSNSCVIWARFTRDIQLIKEALGDQAVTYCGNDSDQERAQNLKLFTQRKKRILISNDQTGGTGLELHHNNPDVIYYSNNTKPILRWQSEDRTHRIGITKSILYVDMIANKSADEAILKALNRHRGFAESTLSSREKVIEFDTTEKQQLESILKETFNALG